MTYGVTPAGFVRKPLSVVLAEIENDMKSQFGSGVLQTAQTPFGQLNGIFADKAAEFFELAEDIYQSLDPDQAEGVRLEILGRIRRIYRGAGQTEESYRQAITNQGQARIDIQDIRSALAAIPGVTYSFVWINDTDEIDANGMTPASLCVAVTGGADADIAQAIRQFIVPGVTLVGSTVVESVIDGYCRSFRVLRPIDVAITLAVYVKTSRDNAGCPPPSTQAIKTALFGAINFLNGEDITYFKVRSIIESRFSNVEVAYIVGTRDGQEDQLRNIPVDIAFIERASLALEDLTVEIAE